MSAHDPFALDERASSRRDSWLSRFLDDPVERRAVGADPADSVLDAMLDHYGEYWNARVAPFFAELYAVSGLEPKVVELIATAALALRGWETGVRAHARLALSSGATPDELRGAMLVLMGIGGITAVASGLHWLEPVLEEAQGQAPVGPVNGPMT